jgi:hypothetical protein
MTCILMTVDAAAQIDEIDIAMELDGEVLRQFEATQSRESGRV